jgi:hypothetical protein
MRSGWLVGWLCDCDKSSADLTIHSAADWTAEILFGGPGD